MNLLKYILLFTILFYVGSALANININEDRYARFSSLTTKDGLCGDYILDILQDNKGFIWIATRTGLTRYDGYHFVNFTHSTDDSLSISSNYVQCLAADKEGTLWVGTKNGLNKYDDKTGTFSVWTGTDKEKSVPSNRYIRKILPDSNAVLWVETVDGVLNKINTKTGKVLYYPHHQVTQEYYSYHCLFKDSDGDIWVGNRGKGPYRFNPESGNIRLIKADPTRKDKKRDPEVAYVIEDSKNRFWVGSIDGFWRFYKDTETFERIIPMSSFHCIEDRNGVLWLSGGNGVYRFDADTNSAVLYSNNESDPHSLINNSVNALFEDRDGNIWIGTNDGISVFSKSDNEIQYIRRLTDSDNTLNSNSISSVLEDNEGHIWFGTQKKGLSKWNSKTDTFTNFQYKKGDNSSLASNNVSALYQDKKNNIWIGLWQGVGFNKYDPLTNTFKKYSCDPDSYKKDWYNSFIEDNEGRFMAGLWGANGIHFFSRKDEKFLPYNFNAHSTPMNYPLTGLVLDGQTIWTGHNNVIYQYHITLDSFSVFHGNDPEPKGEEELGDFNYFRNFHKTIKVDDKLYFATTNGLLATTSTNKQFEELITNTEITAFTKNNGDDILWLGTNKGFGVLTQKNDFKLIQVNSDKNSPLWQKNIINLKEINGKVYVATNLGLLIYDPLSDSFLKSGINSEIHLFNTKVNAIVSYGQEIIVGTDNNLIKINEANNQIELDTLLQGLMINDILTEASHNNLILGTNKGIYCFSNGIFKPIENTTQFNILDITTDNDGRLWAGTNKGLLSVSADCTELQLHNQPGKYCLSSHLVSFLANDSNGNIWAGTTNNGLNRINSKTLTVEHYYQTFKNTGRYAEQKASVFLQQKNGTIWAGGERLHRFNPEANKFVPIPENDFPYKEILSLEEDDNEYLWIGTSDGLVLFNTRTNNAQLFSYLHGLPNFDFSGGSLKLSSGNLLFAGKKGAIIFNPESLSKNTVSNKIAITGATVFGTRIFFSANNESPIKLKYNQNFFTLEFSTMQFSGLKHEYQYMLEGVDPGWVETKDNSASYTNIQPGSYAFKIKSNIGDQEVNTFYLTIRPPFWKTWWFILITIGLASGFIAYWISTLTKKQKTEEQRIILEHKLLQLQMNPHFIFNVLIAIQSFIYRNDTYESGLYLSKFAKLMRIFLQNSRNEWITLAKEIESLQYYLNLQQLRIEGKFEYTVECKNIPDPDYIQIPPMIIQPFVENSIEHGLANLPYPGLIQISFETKESCLEAIIRDNGNGYYPKKGKAKTHESMATEIIQKRIEILNNKKCKTGLTIHNINNEGETGTEVMIRFPYKEEF
ncbi:two-component regulator propeller domain-containing protein [uncultured Draconibacterium sp.]|uniref:two-component regulator propeller domain-containing protein n=1 Tax=uncultured Draconibacterium sp. TaxID=1573823 RepID=UPI0029C792D9|nr:two-component regulator propeller domain-containing protein [uncultured Draconibacterium sp.]